MDSPASQMMTAVLEMAMIRAQWSFSGVKLNAKITLDPRLLSHKLKMIFSKKLRFILYLYIFKVGSIRWN